jgi:hypothetical protein
MAETTGPAPVELRLLDGATHNEASLLDPERLRARVVAARAG